MRGEGGGQDFCGDDPAVADMTGDALAGHELILRLHAVSYAAPDIRLFEFRAEDGAPLPAFAPGAHIDIHLPGNMVRQYSLACPAGDGLAYRVGIKRENGGRGGSRYLFDQARVGDLFRIGGPRNHFPLERTKAHSILIAGGIGVTPIRCMAEQLAAQGLPFELHYAVATRASTAFLSALQGFAPSLHLHVDDERGAVLDIPAIVATAPSDSHFYCCGPAPMLDAFVKATAHLAPERVHLEYFSAPALAPAEGGFTVVLARSGKEFYVAQDQTILQTLREAGMTTTSSCEQGVCGACETRVIEGEPDHRDMLLTAEERAANETMMICCSGSRTARLVLDL